MARLSEITRDFSYTTRGADVGQVRKAWLDISEGLGRWWMWRVLAMQDIKMRYRGSILGPFWVTISTLIMVVAIGGIYPRLLNIPARGYLPYLTTGLVVWSFISTTINEGCTCLLGAADTIKQIKLPFSIHVFRVVFRNLIAFAHSLIVIPIVLIMFSVPVGWSILLIVPGILMLAINGSWISLLLGMVSARFRDIPPIVGSMVTVAFFVTPVFWNAHALGSEKWIVEFNPLFAAIDVVRSPILGEPIMPTSWPVLLLTTAIGCGVTFWIFARLRARIPYWV